MCVCASRATCFGYVFGLSSLEYTLRQTQACHREWYCTIKSRRRGAFSAQRAVATHSTMSPQNLLTAESELNCRVSFEVVTCPLKQITNKTGEACYLPALVEALRTFESLIFGRSAHSPVASQPVSVLKAIQTRSTFVSATQLIEP